MTVGGTSLYHARAGLPSLVVEAVGHAERLGFELSCRPEQGLLLAALAAGRAGGVIGETGTGCGVGLAWMASAAGPGTRLVSVEQDGDRAAAAAHLFATWPNVTVLHGDWTLILAHGPFDLLVLDGGDGSGKTGWPPVDPDAALAPGGTLIVDDFTPSQTWPPRHGNDIDRARVHWLTHPALLATEVPVGPQSCTVVATRRPPASAGSPTDIPWSRATGPRRVP